MAEISQVELARRVAAHEQWQDSSAERFRRGHEAGRGEQLVLKDLTIGSVDLSGRRLNGAYLFGVRADGARFVGTDFSRARLDGSWLRHSDLSGADFLKAELDSVVLRHATLRGARLYRASLHGADLHGADLTDANLTNCGLGHTNLSHARLVGVQLPLAGIERTLLIGTDLRGATGLDEAFVYSIIVAGPDGRVAVLCREVARTWLLGAAAGEPPDPATLTAPRTAARPDLPEVPAEELARRVAEHELWRRSVRSVGHDGPGEPLILENVALGPVDLSGRVLHEALLLGVHADGARFTRADLDRAHFEGSSLRRADLTEANLHDVRLDHADLQHASLRGAKGSSVQLDGADLRGADLRGTNLSAACLVNTDLTDADLRGARLSTAALAATDLAGADLRGATGIDKAHVRSITVVGPDGQPVVLHDDDARDWLLNAAARADGPPAPPGS